MFEFDATSALLVLAVVVGVFFLSNSLGSALSRIRATLFLAVVVVAGALLWVSLAYFPGVLSGVNIFDYFVYLFTLLAPYGILVYGSASLTLAACMLFLIELGLISGYADARVKRRKRGAFSRIPPGKSNFEFYG